MKRVNLSRALLIVEAIVCFGPTFLYLLTGVIFLPHQLILAAGHGVSESWVPVVYYIGVGCLLFGVWRLYGESGAKSSPVLQPRTTLALITLGLCALLLGPMGGFALGRYEDLSFWLVVVFVLLPGAGVVRLIIASREWLFEQPGT